MPRFSVSGRSADTAAAINDVAAQLWNPHASISIFVREIWVFLVGATACSGVIQRSSARGATPGVTVTPDIDSHYSHRFAPISLAVLELANFGTEPTLSTPPMGAFNLPAAAGAGFIFPFPEPIEVKSGTGLCIATPVAVIFQDSDFTFVWDE